MPHLEFNYTFNVRVAKNAIYVIETCFCKVT
jgi:hypothetical protein